MIVVIVDVNYHDDVWFCGTMFKFCKNEAIMCKKNIPEVLSW